MKKATTLLILLPLSLLACATANHLPSVESVVYHPGTELDLSSLSPSTVSSDKYPVTVSWSLANIRSGAGYGYPIVKFVQQGDQLIVIGESGDWFNVRFGDGQVGWISNRVVK